MDWYQGNCRELLYFCCDLLIRRKYIIGGTYLTNSPTLHPDNTIALFNCAQSMSYDKYCYCIWNITDGFHNYVFIILIKCTGCFIKK